ncbi:MAG TPA: hypothetical protein VF446_02220 [Trinickia sp.]
MKAGLADRGVVSKGSSLVEVLIALSLLATSILGAAGAQLAATRNADEQAHREHASWVAASIVEAMRSPDGSVNAFVREKERAGAILPDGSVSVADEAGGIGAVVVEWAHAPGMSATQRAQSFGSCVVADGATRGPCVTLPFVGGGR